MITTQTVSGEPGQAPASIIGGSNVLSARNGPVTFTSNCRFHSASVSSRTLPTMRTAALSTTVVGAAPAS